MPARRDLTLRKEAAHSKGIKFEYTCDDPDCRNVAAEAVGTDPELGPAMADCTSK